jgi:hypothetical protein
VADLNKGKGSRKYSTRDKEILTLQRTNAMPAMGRALARTAYAGYAHLLGGVGAQGMRVKRGGGSTGSGLVHKVRSDRTDRVSIVFSLTGDFIARA